MNAAQVSAVGCRVLESNDRRASAKEGVSGSLKSRLLVHPLASDAGGDLFHNGGKHWSSQSEPEWQILAGHLAFLIVLVLKPRGLFPRAAD